MAGLLQSEGIEATIVGEMLQAAAFELAVGPATSPRVRVAATDEQRARAVIAAWQQNRGDETEPWTCANCHEQVEGNFDICWKCESPKTTSHT